MDNFFAVCALLSSLALVLSLGSGYLLGGFNLSPHNHMLLGLGAALFASILHCLVFAIFTGSGKDARLLVERLGLKAEYGATVKIFRRKIFPPALNAIGLLLIMVILGGALGAGRLPGPLRWAHPIVAWLTIFYNLKIFWKEYLIIKENTVFIQRVNSDAAQAFEGAPPLMESTPDQFTPNEFATHVRAMGRFLCFLAYNLWLPYLYLRFSMALLWVRWEPFLVVSLALFIVGKYFQFKYTRDPAAISQTS